MPWCWEDLANAIILQAIKDYRNARRRTRNKQHRREAQARIREGMQWEEIGDLLHIDRTTAIRWKAYAIEKLTLPENAISIKDAT